MPEFSNAAGVLGRSHPTAAWGGEDKEMHLTGTKFKDKRGKVWTVISRDERGYKARRGFQMQEIIRVSEEKIVAGMLAK